MCRATEVQGLTGWVQDLVNQLTIGVNCVATDDVLSRCVSDWLPEQRREHIGGGAWCLLQAEICGTWYGQCSELDIG